MTYYGVSKITRVAVAVDGLRLVAFVVCENGKMAEKSFVLSAF